MRAYNIAKILYNGAQTELGGGGDGGGGGGGGGGDGGGGGGGGGDGGDGGGGDGSGSGDGGGTEPLLVGVHTCGTLVFSVSAETSGPRALPRGRIRNDAQNSRNWPTRGDIKQRRDDNASHGQLTTSMCVGDSRVVICSE
ncbi:hypothetical protein ACFW04_006845 [Cataglyphis niger]